MGWAVVLHCMQSRQTLALAVGFVLAAAAASRLLRRRSLEAYKRGVVVVERMSRRHRRKFKGAAAGVLTVAGAPIPLPDETKHFKMIGTTGTGKSTAIRELVGGALARGDRAVFADPDGGYRALFFDRYRGDVILNPFERDSVRWDPFAEIAEPYDIEQLASALIPFSEDPSTREWRSYARTFFAAVIRCLHRRRGCDLKELWRLLAMAPHEELRPLVAGTPAQPFLELDNARMFGSIRSVLISAIA